MASSIVSARSAVVAGPSGPPVGAAAPRISLASMLTEATSLTMQPTCARQADRRRSRVSRACAFRRAGERDSRRRAAAAAAAVAAGACMLPLPARLGAAKHLEVAVLQHVAQQGRLACGREGGRHARRRSLGGWRAMAPSGSWAAAGSRHASIPAVNRTPSTHPRPGTPTAWSRGWAWAPRPCSGSSEVRRWLVDQCQAAAAAAAAGNGGR